MMASLVRQGHIRGPVINIKIIMISVCLTTYNGATFIREQLLSVLSQLGECDEVLIADDGSTDDTVAIVDAVADSRVRWVAIGGNLGVVKNFERVLLAAKGDYIFLSDQDDVWLSGKVEATIAALKNSLLVVTDCKVVDANLKSINASFFDSRKSGAGILKNIVRNSYLGCCMAFHKSLLLNAMPMPANVPMHDMWLGLIAETKGRVCFLPKPFLLYRRHGANASPTAEKSNFSLYRKISYRVILCYLLFCRVLFNKFKRL